MLEKNVNLSVESYKTDYKKFEKYDRFKFLVNHIKKVMRNHYSLLDIGGAKGELIYLLQKDFPKNEYVCLEYNNELIEIGKKFLTNVEFIKGDAQDFDLNKQFDIVVMSGVLSIFDNIDNVLKNMIKHIKKDGYGFIFGGFNKDDIDVIVRFKNNYVDSNIWESGWNMFSINSVYKVLAPYVKNFEYKKFVLNTSLKKTSNPVNSYTVELKNGEFLILTGGNIVRDFYLLKFQKV